MKQDMVWTEVLGCLLLFHFARGLTWTSQDIPMPFPMDVHAGVAIADLNRDGAADLIYASDQPYVLINVGKAQDANTFNFSSPVEIGPRGTYRTVDVAFLSSGKVVILLAGGPCTTLQHSCSNEPAVLLEIQVSSCGFFPLETQCRTKSAVLWTDPSPGNDRLAAFSMGLGDGHDPAILVAGDDGVSVYSPNEGRYSGSSFTLNGGAGMFSSVTKLSVGSVGRNPGFVFGSVLASSGVLSKC